jgi:hypothetical protein
MPFADGRQTLMGGIGLEFVEALYARGFLPEHIAPALWQEGKRGAVGFNGEGPKLLMDEFVQGAGVELRFFTSMIDVVADGAQIQVIVLSGKERLYAMQARCYVDATGDATLSAMSGVPFEVGDGQGNTQPPTLCSTVSNIDMERYKAFRDRTRRPGDWQSLLVPLQQAKRMGSFPSPSSTCPVSLPVARDTASSTPGTSLASTACRTRT